MIGYIQSYVEERGYGFILGSDNKKYFFHISQIKNRPLEIEEHIKVNFDPDVNQKGYVAKNITLTPQFIYSFENQVDPSTNQMIKTKNTQQKYEVPTSVYISKEGTVKGWETVQHSSWKVISKNKDLDTAKKDIMKFAKRLGGNALVNFGYDKSTESTGTHGGGTYKYSVHHFSGTVVNIGKKSKFGKKSSDFKNINSIATNYWEDGKQRNASSRKYGIITLFLVSLGFMYSYLFNFPDLNTLSSLLQLFDNPIVEENRKVGLLFFVAIFSYTFIYGMFFATDNNAWLSRK